MRFKLKMIALSCASFVALCAQAENGFLSLPDFNTGKVVWIVRAGVGFNGVTGSAIDTQKTIWDNSEYDGSFKMVTGYDISFGFNKSFGNSPFYWGMDVAFGMRGYKTDAYYSKYETKSHGTTWDTNIKDQLTLKTYNAQLTPFTFGYRYTFLERMAADVHLGVYASYDFAGKANTYYSKKQDNWYNGKHYLDTFEEREGEYDIKDNDNMHKFDAGLNLGVGYWFGPFNIDFTWQRGFIPIYKGGDEEVSVGKGKNDKMEAGNFYTSNFLLKLGFAF